MSDDPIMDATKGINEKDVMEATYNLPEAPASVTVRFWIDDYGVMLTMRGQKVGDMVEQLEYIIDTAKKKGWKSVWDGKENEKQPQKTAPADPNVPVCPVHNRPMKLMSGRYGDFYKCTAKVGDGWCDQKQNIK